MQPSILAWFGRRPQGCLWHIAQKEKSTMPTNIDRHGIQRLLEQGAQLVEVLPPEEYEEEHLPGAINIPLTQLTRATASQLDRHRPVIVYCHDNQ
jgi:rhodanese-related sulfurtransferase